MFSLDLCNLINFNLGQKFGYIFHILSILFLLFGITVAKTLPPQPIELSHKQYQTYGFNCHSTKSIEYIDKELRCNEPPNYQKVHKPNHWDLLIHPLKATYKGSYCSIVKTTAEIRCGIMSYVQVLDVPQTEIQQHVTTSECQALIQESLYSTPEGQAVHLDTTRENVLSFTLGGEIQAKNDKISC